jgi:hypothetical protein
MRTYSPFFQTLHDEKKPTGNLGRGTHYSILRAVVFIEHHGWVLPKAHHSDFAIIWDEDHDTRVIEAVEEIYFAGHLATFIAFGERKGMLTAVLPDDYFSYGDKPRFAMLGKSVEDICQSLPDPWTSEIATAQEPGGLISDSRENVELYLGNLRMLWKLKHKPIERVFQL